MYLTPFQLRPLFSFALELGVHRSLGTRHVQAVLIVRCRYTSGQSALTPSSHLQDIFLTLATNYGHQLYITCLGVFLLRVDIRYASLQTLYFYVPPCEGVDSYPPTASILSSNYGDYDGHYY